MKHSKIHMPNLSYIAAFVIGVILFGLLWKMLAGAATNTLVLAGMIGVAVAVTAFWLRNKSHYHGRKGN
jgi:hypothetical protein